MNLLKKSKCFKNKTIDLSNKNEKLYLNGLIRAIRELRTEIYVEIPKEELEKWKVKKEEEHHEEKNEEKNEEKKVEPIIYGSYQCHCDEDIIEIIRNLDPGTNRPICIPKEEMVSQQVKKKKGKSKKQQGHGIVFNNCTFKESPVTVQPNPLISQILETANGECITSEGSVTQNITPAAQMPEQNMPSYSGLNSSNSEHTDVPLTNKSEAMNTDYELIDDEESDIKENFLGYMERLGTCIEDLQKLKKFLMENSKKETDYQKCKHFKSW